MVGLVRRGALFVAGLLAAEVAYAILRPSPRFQEFDPSGEFGDPALPTIRVAVLGDSSVTAPGVTGPDESWVRLLCHRLSRHRHVLLDSFAVGGSRVADLANGQLEAALASRPDIAIVSVGANDALRFVPLTRFEMDLDKVTATLSASGAVVILSGVGDLGTIPRLYEPLRSFMTARSGVYHRVHHRVAAKYGALVADQRDDDRALWLRDRSLWSEDLFHVSSRGHARWAETAWRTIEPVLGLADG